MKMMASKAELAVPMQLIASVMRHPPGHKDNIWVATSLEKLYNRVSCVSQTDPAGHVV